MIKILIVEDEKPISKLIELNLKLHGYETECVYDGAEAVDRLDKGGYDLVLLDVMLPVHDGFELLEFIRPTGTPVIFITAKGTTEDKVRGLRSGADDYITKPFETVELIARVESVLRRYNKSVGIIEAGNVLVNTDSRKVLQDGVEVELTIKEFDLLVVLVQNRNMAVFRDALYRKVWGIDFIGDSRTLDAHIQHLRKKLHWEDKIKTIYKVGYRLEI